MNLKHILLALATFVGGLATFAALYAVSEARKSGIGNRDETFPLLGVVQPPR